MFSFDQNKISFLTKTDFQIAVGTKTGFEFLTRISVAAWQNQKQLSKYTHYVLLRTVEVSTQTICEHEMSLFLSKSSTYLSLTNVWCPFMLITASKKTCTAEMLVSDFGSRQSTFNMNKRNEYACIQTWLRRYGKDDEFFVVHHFVEHLTRNYTT